MEKWSTVKNGQVNTILPPNDKELLEYNDKGYTVVREVTEKTPYGEKSKITSYSPMTRQEHNEALSKQAHFLTSINDNEDDGGYEKWKGDITYELEKSLNITTSDAQGIIEVQPFKLQQSWRKGLNAKETAKVIDKESRINIIPKRHIASSRSSSARNTRRQRKLNRMGEVY